jgi:hypothetical protein
MTSVYVELVLVAIAAMLSPTTLFFSVLALVMGERPMRTGLFFYAGALTATLAVGVIAAFALGNAAASSKSNTPKTWVAIVDLVAAGLVLAFVWRAMHRPRDPRRTQRMMEQMGRVASSPAIAIVGAGATLANPGGFIPLALKVISETNPSSSEYLLQWLLFSLVSLLPLLLALIGLAIWPDATKRLLVRARGWLERHARTVAAVILVLLAASLLRNGIAGVTA